MDKSGVTQQLEKLLSFYVEQQNAPQLSNMLEISIISKIQDENATRIIISFINKQLAAVSNRHKGLTLLDKIILQCPPSVLADNAISWTNVCVNYSAKDPINNLRFKVLAKILLACSGTPDFNKSVTTLLPKIFDMCLSISPSRVLSEGSLECLKICLQKYPSTCGPFKNKLESYLTKYLTCSLPSPIVKKAGSVFHYLQQIGGSGAEGITHKNNWRNQLIKLCSTMHKLYHRLFARVTEFEDADIDAAPFELALASDEHNGTVPYVTAGVLKNVIVFINCMLVEHFPVEKSISISHILDVIKRGLLVDTYVEFNSSVEDTQFAALLYTHQIDLLYLLRSLIACFKQNLIPFSFTITKLLTDCLQRTQKNYFQNNSDYQKAVYKVLKYWITIAESKLNNNLHNKLVSLIVSEITPAKSNVMLCLTENPTRHKGKGKKRTVQETAPKINGSVENRTQKSLEIKETVCAEALNTGKSLLQHVMLQLDQDTYKVLFQMIIQHLLNIQGGKVVHPYSNHKCQVYLYQMLASILMQPNFCMSPLVQTAINIFTRGQSRSVNSSNDEIFLACSKGLDVLEKLCQGLCSTLHINQHINDDLSNNRSMKRSYDIEEEDGSANDFGISCTISETVVNQNAASSTENVQFSPRSYPPPSSEKIRILECRIIKQANDSIDNINMEDVDGVEEQEDSPQEEMPHLEIESDSVKYDYLSESKTEMKEMIEEEPLHLSQNYNGGEVMTYKSEVADEKEEETVADTGVHFIDTTSLKRTDSMDVDADEAEMMNSFKDVLSQ